MIFLEKESDKISNIIYPVSNNIIDKLVRTVIGIKKTDEPDTIYCQCYKSNYDLKLYQNLEKNLESYLTQLQSHNADIMRLAKQNKEYQWVTINKKQIKGTDYRFYLAPRPENMYKIVQLLTDKFISQGTPVKFKYQLTSTENNCDRIIIYADESHRYDIEKTIAQVRRENPSLFLGSERSILWLYESEAPDVYIAPETPNNSYGKKIAETLIEAKMIFCYLYGINNANPHFSFTGDKAQTAYRHFETIISSLLARNCLLLSPNKLRLINTDPFIVTSYDYATGTLKSSEYDNRGYFEIVFPPTRAGRNALLNNFYSVSDVPNIPGISIRHLTVAERKQEINDILYGHSTKGKK